MTEVHGIYDNIYFGMLCRYMKTESSSFLAHGESLRGLTGVCIHCTKTGNRFPTQTDLQLRQRRI